MKTFKLIMRGLGNLIAATLWLGFYALLQCTVFPWLTNYIHVVATSVVMVVVAISVLFLTKKTYHIDKLVTWPVMVTAITALLSIIPKIMA